MTHDDLVNRAARWLRNTMGCGVVLAEHGSSSSETPDAIGWRVTQCWSILVECKISLSDYYADRKKPFRRGSRGMGQERWYMAPAGVIVPERHPLPAGWGLAEVAGRVVKKTVVPPNGIGTGRAVYDSDRCRAEMPALLSIARALQVGGVDHHAMYSLTEDKKVVRIEDAPLFADVS